MLPDIIFKNENAFVLGSLICDSLIVTLEIFHVVKIGVGGRRGCVTLNVDIVRAYD